MAVLEANFRFNVYYPILVANGAHPNSLDNDGATPLQKVR